MSRGTAGAHLGGTPPLARQPISYYYYACDLSYFDVVLCLFSSRILATNAQISLSRKPRPPQCSLGFPKSPPPKNSRSANVNNTTLYVSVGSFIISWFVLTLHLMSLDPASLFLHRKKSHNSPKKASGNYKCYL